MESICCSSQLNATKKTMASAAAAGLLFLFYTAASEAAHCTVHGATGGNVTLRLRHKLRSGQVIKWMHNNKVHLEFNDNEKLCCDDNDGGALLPSGSLLLTGLTLAKGGKYKPEVFEEGSAVAVLEDIVVCVLDPVPKPRVNFTCEGPVLKCTVQESANGKHSFKWFHNSKEVTGTTSQTYSPQSLEGQFYCAVYNEVSEQKSDAVSLSCATHSFVFPEELFGVSIWIYVAAGGVVVLLLLLVIICCCIRNRRRRRMRIKDEEEYRLRLAVEGQQQQPQHHSHHHRNPSHHHQQQQQPPGHTGPRQHRHKGQQGPKGSEPPGGQPRPSPRRPEKGPQPVGDDEVPPPLPQPRKNAPRGRRA